MFPVFIKMVATICYFVLRYDSKETVLSCNLHSFFISIVFFGVSILTILPYYYSMLKIIELAVVKTNGSYKRIKRSEGPGCFHQNKNLESAIQWSFIK